MRILINSKYVAIIFTLIFSIGCDIVSKGTNEISESSYSVESTPDGLGQPLPTLSLNLNETKTLHLVKRNRIGSVVNDNAIISWSITGDISIVVLPGGKSAVLNAGSTPGTGTVSLLKGGEVVYSMNVVVGTAAVDTIAVSNLQFTGISETGFTATIDFTDDENNNSTATLYYCNDTDSSGCDPTTGTSAAMSKSGSTYTVAVSGLSSPNDPGDVLNIRVVTADTDGVTGSPQNSTVTLISITKIYRSAGTVSGAIQTGTGNNMTISAGVVTFATGVKGMVGVGDAIQYDCDGDDDGIANLDADDCVIFIHGRTSSTQFTVRKADGSSPPDLGTADVDWSIYRSYVGLTDAEAGTVNSGIDSDLASQVTGGNRDLVTNNEQWNIACYNDGSIDITSNVWIKDWTTSSDYYLRVFTPTDVNEVGVSQRHEGKWDPSKYVISGDWTIYVEDDHVRIEGLQIDGKDMSQWASAVIFANLGATAEIYFSDNIVKTSGTHGGNNGTFAVANNNNANSEFYIFNNIIYDKPELIIAMLSVNTGKVWIYNNTVHATGASVGIGVNSPAQAWVKNNICQGSASSCYSGAGFQAGSDYNLSDDGSNAGGSNNVQSVTVDFVDSANGDYRLSIGDKFAKGAGVDLSGDTDLAFNEDIIGSSRPASWDIGASNAISATDRLGMARYRSVGPGSTSALTDGTSNAVTIDSEGIALFSSPLANNIGVGDAVQYDSLGAGANAIDSVAFVHERLSSVQFLLRTATGGVPAATTADQDWSICRAYLNLSDAVTGSSQENTACLDDNIEAFEFYDTNGYDLVTNDAQLHIALYADAEDTVNAALTGVSWVTDESHYIRLFTPYKSREVGVTQRHSGVWDASKYIISSTSSVIAANNGDVDNVIVEGLQVHQKDTSSPVLHGILISNGRTTIIQNNIVRGDATNTGVGHKGIYSNNMLGYARVSNNIVYDFVGIGSSGIAIDGTTSGVLYSNTTHNCRSNFQGSASTIYLKNNIAQSCNSTCYSGTFTLPQANISEDASSPNVLLRSKSILFLNEASDDFTLSNTDTDAVGAGLDLSSDLLINFTRDIADRVRPAPWDIGATNAMP